MDKESVYLLQKLDCNCNDCKFMFRDEIEYNLWKGYTEHMQYVIFLRARRVLLKAAGNSLDEQNLAAYKVLSKDAMKLRFQFDKSQLTISYGVCLSRNGKFSQPVSFMPNTYQIDTQKCFVHRKDELLPGA